MPLPLTHGPAHPFTFADLDAIPEDGRRWELIGGSLLVSPAPSGAHQRCVMELAAALHAACTGDALVIPARYDWRAEATGESFQPDVTVIRRGDFDPNGPLRATPLLVAEVVSPGREDQYRAFKRVRYEALRVPAYWMVDPARPSLTELRLSGRGRYSERATVIGDGRFTTDHPFPVSLTLSELAWRG